MDTSKERIKMCEKAKEIQKQWKPKEGDFVKWNEEIVCLADYEGSLLIKVKTSCGRSTDYQDEPYFTYLIDEKNNCIWLPRQDQLQKMVLNKTLPNPIAGLIWDFSSFADPSEDIHKICVSMEQLWLAFVMKELYNKFWNGEDWINDKR